MNTGGPIKAFLVWIEALPDPVGIPLALAIPFVAAGIVLLLVNHKAAIAMCDISDGKTVFVVIVCSVLLIVPALLLSVLLWPVIWLCTPKGSTTSAGFWKERTRSLNPD